MYNAASSLAKDFYDQQSNLAIGRLTRVESALALNDIVTAQNENTFLPANNLEQHQQQVNEVRIKMADTTQQLSGSVTTLLFTIANGCPELDGTAVYDARTLLNFLYGQPMRYSSNCADSNSYRFANVKQSNASLLNNLKVYPNPANGSFKCSLVGMGLMEINVELRNSIGEVVLKKLVKLNEQGEFAMENVSGGVYLLTVNTGILIMNQKVLVIE